jgi:hypothetical protein
MLRKRNDFLLPFPGARARGVSCRIAATGNPQSPAGHALESALPSMTSSLSGVIVLESNEPEEKAMEPQVMPTTEVDETDEDLLVHSWRVEQLRAVGLTQLLAEIFADLVDWHEVATLVERGCTPELALEIAL